MIYKLVIPDWRPTSLNKLLYTRVRTRIKLKKTDHDFIGCYAFKQGIPKAQGKRRVSLEFILSGRQKVGDDDNYWKSTLDGLVHAGLLVDDYRDWCERGTVTWARGERTSTTIVLEDVT